MTGKSNDVNLDEAASLEKTPVAVEPSLGYRTRVATIAVSVGLMLFCAIFWQSVLDFKSKIERNPNLDEFAEETRALDGDSGSDAADLAANDPPKEDDWREQLAALYPREEFDVEESAPASVAASESYEERAARFNAFDPDVLASASLPSAPLNSETTESEALSSEALADAPQPDDEPLPPAPTRELAATADEFFGLNALDGAPSPAEALENDDAALVAAAPFEDKDDAPLPEAPRRARSAYAADHAPENEPNPASDLAATDAPEDDSILAQIPPPTALDDPLGLDSAPSSDGAAELPAAPDVSLALDAGGIAPSLQVAPDAPSVPDAPVAAPRADVKSPVASTAYSALAASEPKPALAETPLAATATTQTSSFEELPLVGASEDSASSLAATPTATKTADPTLPLAPAPVAAAPVAPETTSLEAPATATSANPTLPLPPASVVEASAAPETTPSLFAEAPSLHAEPSSVALDATAPVEVAPENAPIADGDASALIAAQDVAPAPVAESAQEPAPAPDVRPSQVDLDALANAVFEPSYFSRAVGLFGGQDAFSALYFARAAKIVSDSTSWSPESWSRVAPVALGGLPAPQKTPNATEAPAVAPAPSRDLPPSADGSNVVAPEDDARAAAAMHAKYPTLVGYIERKTPQPSPTTPDAPPVATTAAQRPN